MNFSFLFLLFLVSCERLLGEKQAEEKLWELHLTEYLMRGKGSGPIREAKHLLYCRAGIGFHLQILPDGSVGGAHVPTPYCWLKVFAMKRGVVGIRGTQSGSYLCMNAKGRAYGAKRFSDDCLFYEKLEENHYTTYSSHSHPGNYLALSPKGALRRGVNANRSCTHFLPRTTP